MREIQCLTGQRWTRRCWTGRCLTIVAVLGLTFPLRASVVTEAQTSLNTKDYKTVVSLLKQEIKDNPGHEEAYIVLARAYEGMGNKEKAAHVWGMLKKITRVESRISEARLGLLRTRGPLRPNKDAGRKSDPFHVDVGEIDYETLGPVDQVTYQNTLPPKIKESRNFIVFAPTQAMADKGAELCEEYLSFLLKEFLDGQAWARRIPILIYKDHSDYVTAGRNPGFSAGVTSSDHLGRSMKVALYMLDGENKIAEDNIIGTLPHELTHVVINEFFGAQDVPRWLNEALARRMEQTRDHYAEAAKLGRDVVAGEYYRFRDLFQAENYPDGFFRVWRFYEQSATIVLYLLEQGPESMVAFLQALKDNKGHDAAAAAALGIPEKGAVEELERRWVEWMKERFANDLSDDEKHEAVTAEKLAEDPLDLGDSEIKTVEAIKKWTPISTDSKKLFKGIGGSLANWTSQGGRLVFKGTLRTTASALAVRMDQEVPMVLRFKVKWNGTPGRDNPFFGVGMLDHRGDDTGITVMAEFLDRRPHTITCVVNDDIALYLDGECMGRAPALRVENLDEDIFYPLSIVTYAPVQIFDIESAKIEHFEEKTIAKASGN